MTVTDILLFSAMAVATAGMSYGAAIAGEPQSAWLWCTILKACA